MNKLIKLLSAFMASFILAGCASVAEETTPPGEHVVATPYYDIYQEDGARYLYLNSEKFHPLDTVLSDGGVSSDSLKAAPHLCFSDLGEMKRDIEAGNFTEKELREISRAVGADRTRIQIVDTSRLYEPVLPEELEMVRGGDEDIYVLLGNEGYSSGFYSEKLHASFNVCSEEAYHSAYDNAWTERATDTSVNSWITQDSDRNATVLTTNDTKTLRKWVKYEISDETKNLTVIECYSLSDALQYELWRVNILGVQDGQCFYVTLHSRSNPEKEYQVDYEFERPSIEWLSQFGLRKFEG